MSQTKELAKPKMERFTFKRFEEVFPDDASCLEWLRQYLYPNGIDCKLCKKVTMHHRVSSRPSYSCDYCGHHVHPTAGTIFHKSPTSLKTWFHAIYLMASTRCGISAKQIERETGVTYKTAWRIFNKIRTLLQDDGVPLSGSVEMDETYFGGKRKGGTGRPMRGDKNKTPIVGMVERKGRLKAFTIAGVDGATLLSHAKEHILPESTVYTDELYGYDGLSHMNRGYRHRRIKHSAKVYVVGDIHTNSSMDSGRSLNAGSAAYTIRSARSFCRTTWMSTRSATTIGTTRNRCSRRSLNKSLRPRHSRENFLHDFMRKLKRTIALVVVFKI